MATGCPLSQPRCVNHASANLLPGGSHAAQLLEAVAATRGDDFDLMLIDMQMPRMDGLTAIRLIRAEARTQRRPSTPIVVLSANAMAEHMAASAAAGADAHLCKPIRAAELLTTIGELTRKSDRAAPLAVAAD